MILQVMSKSTLKHIVIILFVLTSGMYVLTRFGTAVLLSFIFLQNVEKFESLQDQVFRCFSMENLADAPNRRFGC